MTPDADGYPTDEELRRIETWPFEGGWWEFMEFVKSCWWASNWGWRQRGRSFSISTGGWSGNEDIIEAMFKNVIFWADSWVSHRVGGHYRFMIPKRGQTKRGRRRRTR